MKSYIQNFHQKKTKKPYIAVSLDNKRKSLLKPIKTIPLYLNYHSTNIDPALDKEIKKRYPTDKTTKYKSGEIKGFF